MNNSTLITFLGRVPKGEQGGYRQTRYDFGDGEASDQSAFFGWVLQKRIKPQRMVVLGTPGSMWDHLFETDVDLGSEDEEGRLELAQAVEDKQVSQDQLDRLAPLLNHSLQCEVLLQIIPYCHDDQEQVELLKIMADHVQEKDRVELDVTHGFRHLPMLGMLSALHLRRVRRVSVDRIWYGAFDPDTGSAPVHDLAGLLHIADWIEALSVYDHAGEYGIFAKLIGGDAGKLLAEASFLESINQIGQARSRLKKVLKMMEEAPQDPALSLFRSELKRRISWATEQTAYARQRMVAIHQLSNGRLRAAALTGYEAYITRLVRQRGGDPEQTSDREIARDEFDQAEKTRKKRSKLYRAWDSLRRLRNALVHGNRASGDEVQRALSSPMAMTSLLEELFDLLLVEEESR